MRSKKTLLLSLLILCIVWIFAIFINKDFVSSKFLFWSAYLKQGIGNNEGAIQDYTTAIKFSPDFPIAYINRSSIYSDQKKHSQALNDLNSAYELDPYNPSIFAFRGRVLYELKRHDEALSDYNLAIQLNGELPYTYYNRGLLYCTVYGNFELGCKDLKMASNLGFTSADRLMSLASCSDQ